MADRCCEAAYCFGHQGHMSYCTTVGLHRWQLEPVYTIQPVVKPVEQPVEQPTASCKQTFNRSSTRLLNRFDNRLYRVNGVLHGGFEWIQPTVVIGDVIGDAVHHDVTADTSSLMSVSLKPATCPQRSSFISYSTRLHFIATVVVNVNHYSRLVNRILVLLFRPNIVPGT